MQDSEYFKSNQTVADVIEVLKQFPLNAKIGTFDPFDGDGPCNYTPLLFSLDEATGQILVNPDYNEGDI